MTGQVCNYPARHLASVCLAVAPNGRSPSVSLQHQSMPGPNAADGWFNIVSLVFPGELSIPLTDEARDEASFEFDSDPKGVFLESFYRKGLGSLGAHVFSMTAEVWGA